MDEGLRSFYTKAFCVVRWPTPVAFCSSIGEMGQCKKNVSIHFPALAHWSHDKVCCIGTTQKSRVKRVRVKRPYALPLYGLIARDLLLPQDSVFQMAQFPDDRHFGFCQPGCVTCIPVQRRLDSRQDNFGLFGCRFSKIRKNPVEKRQLADCLL